VKLTPPAHLDEPWGVQLSTGEQCLLDESSNANFEGRPVQYFCGGSNLRLLAYPNREGNLWQFLSVRQGSTPSEFTPGPVETVDAAYYAEAQS
jgi:hypothetical protein